MKSRADFWRYCCRVENASRDRARQQGLPHNITAHDVDVLLVDQKWRCAVSRVILRATRPKHSPYRLDPFGPSLDRIVPDLGYVHGNVRVVCNMANYAMNQWGLENLRIMVAAMTGTEEELRATNFQIVGQNL